MDNEGGNTSKGFKRDSQQGAAATDQATNAIMKLDDATIREVMVSPEFLYYQAHMKGIENAVLQMTTDAGATQIPDRKVFHLMGHNV